jgi:hypothetical protein
MNKLLSGRFIFTMIAAFVFLILSVNRVLPVDKVHEILLIVIYGYFQRTDRQTPNKGA